MNLRMLGLAAAAALAFVSAAWAEDPTGTWLGQLGPLRIVFRVQPGAAGGYQGSIESPDQSSPIIPAQKVEVGDDHLSIAIPSLTAVYDAAWDAGKKAWVGQFTQRGVALPLAIHRASPDEMAALKPARPQEDAAEKALAAFRPETVSIPNTAVPGVTLAGVFTRPKGDGPFPAVVLIAGSGAQTRDEDVLGHKEFLVLADMLNRRGVAVLRYDKRGVGRSTGDYKDAATADFASDATGAFRYLLSRSDVDPKRVGLLGHSEGGVSPGRTTAAPIR